MKWAFAFLSLLGSGSLLFGQAKEVEPHFYFDLGLGPLTPSPEVGIGCRLQPKGGKKLGGDFALRVSPGIFSFTFIKMSALGLYYPKANPEGGPEAGWYLGMGPALFYCLPMMENDRAGFGLSAEWSFGQQYKTSKGAARFWQIQTGFPNYYFGTLFHRHFSLVPMPTFSYGFLF